MTWKVCDVTQEKMKFVSRILEGERMSDACRLFGISRKTGYKLMKRFRVVGLVSLQEQSRARRTQSRKTPESLRDLIIKVRQDHPSWGARKIKSILETLHRRKTIPAPSVIHTILDQHGLITARPKSCRPTKGANIAPTLVPGELWCADFKGQFELGDKKLCYPLTATDFASRFILKCESLQSTNGGMVRIHFEKLFEKYGLPKAIRTDNGPPFASPAGLLNLTYLSAWWVSQGIQLQRIDPGKPQQNGRHERMHLTLKQETTRPAAANYEAQQKRFDEFILCFNESRPHQALDMKTPIVVFNQRPILKSYEPEKQLSYPLHDFTKRVTNKGDVYFYGNRVFLGEALGSHLIGLREEQDNIWRLSFAYLDLGFYDSRSKVFTPVGSIGDKVLPM